MHRHKGLHSFDTQQSSVSLKKLYKVQEKFQLHVCKEGVGKHVEGWALLSCRELMQVPAPPLDFTTSSSAEHLGQKCSWSGTQLDVTKINATGTMVLNVRASEISFGTVMRTSMVQK